MRRYTDAEVRIRLGHEPVLLPEPLAGLVRHVAATRQGHAAIGDQAASPWLFPGGQPAHRWVNGVFPGLMDISQVTLPDGAAYYLCGPLPFMQAVRSALLERGVPPEDIQYEVFGPDLWQADFD